MVHTTPTVASVFAMCTKDVSIDGELVKRIHLYERGLVNSSTDFVEFMGGHLMGVHPIRFKSSDRDRWFMDVIEVDELELRDGILSLPTIDESWKRASDAMNLSVIWLLHALYHSNLPPALKTSGMVDALLILQYKFLCSLMAHYYPFPADRGTMEAAYAAMTRRYVLKKAGSWNRLLRERAQEIISPSGVHRDAFTKFNSDKAIIDMVQDIQTRMRKIVQNMTELFYQMRSTGARVGTDSMTMVLDGEATVKESSKKWPTYIRYAHQTIDDVRSFIKPELLKLVADLQHTVDPKRLEEALDWISYNQRTTNLFPKSKWDHPLKGTFIEDYVDEVMLFTFELLTNQKHLVVANEVGPVLSQMRSLMTAPRMVDPSLIKIRDMGNLIVEDAVRSRNPSMLASVRTAMALYIICRTLTMSHYSS